MTVTKEHQEIAKFVSDLTTEALGRGWAHVSLLATQGGAIGITVQTADQPFAYSKTLTALERTEYRGGAASLIDSILDDLSKLHKSNQQPEELPVVDPDEDLEDE